MRGELSRLIGGLGAGWVGKKVAPKGVEPGCYGCGNLGKQHSLTMLTRLEAAEKAVLFTLVELCPDCAGDKVKTDAMGEKVFGPLDPPPAQQ